MSTQLKEARTLATRLDTALTIALTFDDILLVPRHSTVLPAQVDVGTHFTRNIRLNVPLLSAAMDTVTESEMAIAMAQQGGLGIIHKNLPIEQQASEVDRVKRSESGMIVNPITLSPNARIFEALELMRRYRISGVPITDDGSKEGRLVGILTNRDLRFETNVDRAVAEVMTKDQLFTVPVGTTLDQAREILHTAKVEKLLVVDQDYRLKGLITVKDIQKAIKYPNACKDSLGRLRCGAAVGIARDTVERAEALVDAHVDVLVVDTAHGHSQGVLDMVSTLRRTLPERRPRRRQRRHRRRHRGADRSRRRRGQGRHRRRLDLHHPHGGRHRRADDHLGGGVRGGGRPSQRAGDRRRRHPHVGRRGQGPGRGRQRGDDRQPVRRHRRKPGRADPLPGPHVQGIPRHGLDRRHAQGLAAIATSRTTSSSRAAPARPARAWRSWCPRASRAASRTRAAWRWSSTSWWAACAPAWATAARRPFPDLQRDAKFIRITNAGLRESHVHDVTITKESPNYRME